MTEAYTRRSLGIDLQRLLREQPSVQAIARWAHLAYLDLRERDADVNDVLMSLIAMDEGPEFELPLAVLDDLAHALVVGDEASVKEILKDD
jgi:hypothetical protein